MVVLEINIQFIHALEANGIENASFEAAELLVKAGIPKLTLLYEPYGEVRGEIVSRARELLERRLNGEPLQYLIGEWEFYGLPFKVGEGVLIPRQDTETLVEAVLEFLKPRPADKRRVLDLCAGTGCVGISLAKLAAADVTCVELSDKAFAFLTENIALNGVSVKTVHGDIFDSGIFAELRGFDAIVSNPPYLTGEEMNALQKEVSHEPETALYGGSDGLEFCRKISEIYKDRIVGGGMLALEIGYEQADSAAAIFTENGLIPQFKRDLCGVERVIYAILSDKEL